MRRAFAIWFLLGGASFSARAELVTIDPDNYAIGTDLTHAVPGVTLRALRQPGYPPGSIPYYDPTVLPVIAADCPTSASLCGDPAHTSDFGWQDASGYIGHGWGRIEYWYGCSSTGHTGYCRDGFTVLDMVLDNPTDYLQFQAAGGPDPAAFMAFNSAGERVLYCNAFQTSCGDGAVQIQTTGLGGHQTTITVQLASADIARVVFGAFMGSAAIGQITYNNVNVPEPGTLALLSFGLLGAGVARRRKV